MKILHYALGFPPYRSGGLTKFCVDLMVQQAKEGHSVAMIWPGQMGFINKQVAIRKQKSEKIKDQNIQSLRLLILFLCHLTRELQILRLYEEFRK